MELRPEFLMPIIAKTLRDVVLPALDENQQVAAEQLKLAIGFLDIMGLRAPLQSKFDEDEHRRHAALTGELRALISEAKVSLPASAFAEPVGDEASLVTRTRSLRREIAILIEAGHTSGIESLSQAVHDRVLAFASVQLKRERAWVEPMGFEGGAAKLTPVEEQLQSR